MRRAIIEGMAAPATSDLDALLDRALVDRALSRDERREIARQLLGDGNERRVRDRAFALVARRLGPDAQAFLQWLEDVVELTVAPEAAGLAEVYESPGEASWERIAELCAEAQTTLDVCVFTITDDRISGEIYRAHRREVAVRVISDDEKAHEPGSDVHRLAEAGVPVRVDRSIHHMHHKFALFDQKRVLSGSYNWTRAAAESNQDNFLVTDEPRIVGGYRAIFERTWAAAKAMR